ncbi:MAG: PEP-CTERM sorting domain-containing protein [Bryobacteraceae bacterium]|nr:PEP-CTERM sorting domain-containing protein [Bryobacteraceae bacterium]
MTKFAVLMCPLLLTSLPTKLSGVTVDVIVVVDESGSMAGEHAWLPGMITSLNSALTGLGYDTRFGLYGFGNGLSGGANSGRELLDAGTAAAFGTAAVSLVTSGGTEDGYAGLNFALNNYSFTSGSIVNYILVTDEDRDNTNVALTFAGMQAALGASLLNAVVDNPFSCAAGTALGVDSTSTGYRANGSGGFTSCASGTVGNGAGTTEADYVALAHALGGAGWDLNQLRAGGLTADSFTAAFVNIKVQEIQQQDPGSSAVPEPGTLLLSSAALGALLAFRRVRPFQTNR